MVARREQTERDVTAVRGEAKDAAALKESLIREVERLESRRESVAAEYDGLVMKLFDEYELTLSEAAGVRVEIESVPKAQRRLGEIRSRMKGMGDVNVGAIDEYQAVKQRHEFLLAQTNDLTTAKADIEKVIADLTQRMKTIFSERFKIINERFKAIFADLFGRRQRRYSGLTDPGDVLGFAHRNQGLSAGQGDQEPFSPFGRRTGFCRHCAVFCHSQGAAYSILRHGRDRYFA